MQRGRKSIQQLAVVPIASARFQLKPPPELPLKAKAVFSEIVASCGANHFRKSDVQLLAQYANASYLASFYAPLIGEDAAAFKAWESAVKLMVSLTSCGWHRQQGSIRRWLADMNLLRRHRRGMTRPRLMGASDQREYWSCSWAVCADLSISPACICRANQSEKLIALAGARNAVSRRSFAFAFGPDIAPRVLVDLRVGRIPAHHMAHYRTQLLELAGPASRPWAWWKLERKFRRPPRGVAELQALLICDLWRDDDELDVIKRRLRDHRLRCQPVERVPSSGRSVHRDAYRRRASYGA
jgi:hypothetical protein